MKHLLLIIAFAILGVRVFAQSPPFPSVCPDFTATDLDGNTWHLYDLLAQGKTVFIDVSATWSSPDWNYFNSGALQTLFYEHGPNGDNTVMVLYIEADPSTGLADLQGTTSSSQGDWITGTPFPMIQSDSIMGLLNISYFPTIFRVCPTGQLNEVGQLDAIGLYAAIGTCDVVSGVNNAALTSVSFNTEPYCPGSVFPLSVKVKNNGSAPLASVDIVVSLNGVVVQTLPWAANPLGTFSEVVVTLNDILLSDATSDVSVSLVNPNGVADDDPSDNSMSVSNGILSAASIVSDVITVDVLTDNFGGEISWEMLANGVVVASGGNMFGDWYESNFDTLVAVSMPIQPNTCLEFRVYDSFGDGICCNTGQGHINLVSNGTVLASFTDFDSYGAINLFVSHPASVGYTPVSGHIYHDLNGNGTDDGEPNFAQVLVGSSAGSFSSSNIAGNYTIYLPLGDSIHAIAPQYAVASPAYYTPDGSTDTLDFGIYYTPGITDVSISQTAVPAFRPGFATYITVTASNIGVDAASGQVYFVPPPFVTVNSTTPAATINGDTLVWDYSNLAMGDAYSVLVTVTTAVGTELGTEAICQAWVTTDADDINPYNNYNTLTKTVVGSFDPNDKTFEPAIFTPENVANHDPIVYTVRFQNTGNFPADFVRIIDTLPQNANIATFRVIMGSHPYTWNMTGNGIVEFMFANINLLDSFTNEAASHGFIKYSVEAREDLELGDELSNTAYIYFDFNEAVVTNTAVTTIEMVSSTHTPNTNEQLGLMPNPTEGIVRVVLPIGSNGNGSLQVVSMLGQKMMQKNTTSDTETIDISNLPSGIYLIQWRADGKQYIGKVARK